MPPRQAGGQPLHPIFALTTAVVWPTCFLVGAFWGAEGLAASWLESVPATFLINFPRTSASLGVEYRDVVRTMVCPMVAGAVMLASIAGMRLVVGDWTLMLRASVLVAIGAAAYLVVITLLDRSMWSRLRLIATASSAST